MQRKTGLKRSAMKRGKARLGHNPKRKASAFLRNFRSVDRVTFTRNQPCAACMEIGNVQNAHHKARGMGGCGGTYLDIVPLCMRCHHAQEAAPVTFWTSRNLDPVALAALHEERWQQWAAQWGYAA